MQAGVFAFFCAAALYASYTDVVSRRVSNRLTGWGLCLVVPLFFLHAGRMAYAPFFFITGLAFLTAVALWRANIWAAGDAKFFIFGIACACFFVSERSLIHPPAGIPLFFIVLCNAFILALVYVLLETIISAAAGLFTLSRRGLVISSAASAVGRVFHPSALLAFAKLILFYLISFVVYALASKYAGAHIPALLKNNLLFYGIMLLISQSVRAVLQRVSLVLLVIALCCAVYAARLDIVGIAASAAHFCAVLWVISSSVGWFVRKHETTMVAPKNITAGLVLSRDEIDALPKERTADERFSGDGLTSRQAEALRRHYVMTGRQWVRICYTFPFVPFISLAVALVRFTGPQPINIYQYLP